MTEPDFDEAINLIADAWPRWTITNARRGALWRVFGRFTINDFRRAVRAYLAENMDSYKPNIERIREMVAPLAAAQVLEGSDALAENFRKVLMKESAQSQIDEQYWHNTDRDTVLDEWDRRQTNYLTGCGITAKRWNLSRPHRDPLTEEEEAMAQAHEDRGGDVRDFLKPPKLGSAEHCEKLSERIVKLRNVLRRWMNGERVTIDEVKKVYSTEKTK